MLRKIIFIGQAGKNAIFFNTETQELLKAPKNSMLDMDKTKNNGRNIIIILIAIMFFSGIIGYFAKFNSHHVYTPMVVVVVFLLWIIETIILTCIVERALYGPIKKTKIEPATKAEFRQAMLGNNLWNIFSNKKATSCKRIGMSIFTLIVVVLTLSIIPLVFIINSQRKLLGHEIGSELIPLSTIGVLPFVAILLIWINNPVRWLNTVEKHQQKKL